MIARIVFRVNPYKKEPQSMGLKRKLLLFKNVLPPRVAFKREKFCAGKADDIRDIVNACALYLDDWPVSFRRPTFAQLPALGVVEKTVGVRDDSRGALAHLRQHHASFLGRAVEKCDSNALHKPLIHIRQRLQ